jgi:hypothetical protein
METVLEALLYRRHIQTHEDFTQEYNRVARRVDPLAVGRGPTRSQFYRWRSRSIASFPRARHCRVLEAMFPGWDLAELFSEFTDGVDLDREAPPTAAIPHAAARYDMADVEAVYPSRTEFLQSTPPAVLFTGAKSIGMVGLSLNLLCQNYSDAAMRRIVARGCVVRCLFLDPDGGRIRERELEEGHAPGALRTLTRLNIQALDNVRRGLQNTAKGRIDIRVYDEPLRFNITVVDETRCVVQPYLPKARGVQSPTFVARKSKVDGVFHTFSDLFHAMWLAAADVAAD